MMASSLYIHIPFCIRKCRYCDFPSIPYERDLAKRFVMALCGELRLKRQRSPALKSVFLGGGTPSLLDGEDLMRIFLSVRENFLLSRGTEITVEVNPGTLTEPKIADFISLGVTRVSMGVQSLQDRELETLGRTHTAQDAVTSVTRLRASSPISVSVDLIYGIPGQTAGSWKDTLLGVIGLAPHHVSSYELTPEKDTPLHALLTAGALKRPDEDRIMEMYWTARDILTGHGYDHYEVSNYAFPGHRCLHNLNYWRRGEYVGAGAGAHSFQHGVRMRNTADVGEYCAAVEGGLLPVAAQEQVSPAEALRETIFLGLRTSDGISITTGQEAGISLEAASRDLVADGHLAVGDGRVVLTPRGFPVMNAIVLRLFGKLGI